MLILQNKQGLVPTSPFSDNFNDNFSSPVLWKFTGNSGGVTVEQNQRMECTRQAALSGAWLQAQAVFNYKAIGDFDIYTDLNTTSITNTSDTVDLRTHLLVGIDDGVGGYQYFQAGTAHKATDEIYAWSSGTSPKPTYNIFTPTGFNDIIKFRLTRVGTAITAYYDNGGGWVQYSSASGVFANDCRIWLKQNSASAPSTDQTCYFDNFNIIAPSGFNPI